MPKVKSPGSESVTTPAVSEEEQKARLSAEIEKSEKLAGSQLHMAEWFLAEGKVEIAFRRLAQLIETLPDSSAAERARLLMQNLQSS